jgi:hypothetical protein
MKIATFNHLLLSPAVAEGLTGAGVDRALKRVAEWFRQNRHESVREQWAALNWAGRSLILI